MPPVTDLDEYRAAQFVIMLGTVVEEARRHDEVDAECETYRRPRDEHLHRPTGCASENAQDSGTEDPL
ncbi:hypothetical protein H483_0108040 [Dietzia sp. UCD-THP]|uniref:hypothetical protein n=1 Tax=Dietzia sp. UCD-THP TaxID=1292020 RepID=UPI000374B05B|nr:hypothetical protein [Dietzia sp. UCD-THP]EYT63441.1 hypothetical protein H483_0108040 [Dietzia sp. UCD-THP]MDZ4233091.1 hypothetical protein [Dietzia sp.]